MTWSTFVVIVASGTVLIVFAVAVLGVALDCFLEWTDLKDYDC